MERYPNSSRQAAVLVCVLVVLLIVGLLISQTVQTLLLVRRGDNMRQSLRQARELIALGELVLQQNNGNLPSAEILVSLAAAQSEPSSALDSTDTVSDNGDDRSQHIARITFQRLDNADAAPEQMRIIVTYRPGTAAEITATETVAIKEKNHAATQ